MNTVLQLLQSQIGKDSAQSPSPVGRWLNPTILSAEEGEIALELTIREEFCNPVGQLHGGLSSLIIDECIGIAVFSYGEPTFYSTVNLAVDFLSSVRLGEVVIINAKVLKKGRRLVNAYCEIINKSNGRIAAKGTTNLVKVEMP